MQYLRPLGDGAVLYNTLGHCRGHYDMVPLKDYYPTIERCSWETAPVLRAAPPGASAGRWEPTRMTTTPEHPTRLVKPTSTTRHGAHPLLRGGGGRLFEANKIPGFIHLYVGQEAVAAGVCVALRDDDQISSTHRGHGHLVAKGGDLNRMMAELMGKATGYCNGKGGSMHICDLELNMLGANGIVGGGVPIAVGAGFANKYRGNDTVAVAFFGDGATNIGAFHEAANMAAALQLPVLFVCENNEYAEYTPRAADDGDQGRGRAGRRPTACPGRSSTAWTPSRSTRRPSRRSRRSAPARGPSFLECKTYRYYNHHGIQTLGMKYRSDEEVEEWKAA